MPPNTVKVARPSKWGNPYSMETARKLMPNATDDVRRLRCVRAFSIWVTGMEDVERNEYLAPLRGKNLACFCAPNEVCHADVLLELANADVSDGGSLAPKCKPLLNARRSLHRLVRRPRGRIPSDTKAWLAVNEPDCGWQIAVCKCGGWYHQMDHLAPYHTEMNWCPKCKHKGDWNGPDYGSLSRSCLR